MVEPGRETVDVPRCHVDLGLVQGARRRCRTEQYLTAAGIHLLLRDARGEVEKGGEPLEVEGDAVRRPSSCDRRQRVEGDGLEAARQRHGRRRGVDLEWKGLVVPVEGVAARA